MELLHPSETTTGPQRERKGGERRVTFARHRQLSYTFSPVACDILSGRATYASTMTTLATIQEDGLEEPMEGMRPHKFSPAVLEAIPALPHVRNPEHIYKLDLDVLCGVGRGLSLVFIFAGSGTVLMACLAAGWHIDRLVVLEWHEGTREFLYEVLMEAAKEYPEQLKMET